ncbi:MAG: DUF4003 domain-containing protein [Firmicutes bacterium]|nr:DUF4003 domain-containing protein [Bacillota bacterium]
MLDKSLEKQYSDYLEVFMQLKKKLKCKIQKEIIAMISSIYIINEKEFDLEELLDVSKYIKNNVGMFSYLRSHQKYIIAAMLITKHENPKTKFHDFIKYQDKLIEGGFKKGSYTAIAALALMTTNSEYKTIEKRVDKALEIYKGMKSNHFFLTSQNDYPLAVLLSQFNKSTEILMEDVEKFYTKLSNSNFKKGNDLQLLSHILMLSKEDAVDRLVNKCNEIYERLTNRKIKLKKSCYPQVGLIAIINSDLNEEIDSIEKLVTRLNSDKRFKYMKTINLIISTSLVTKNKVKDKNLIETGLSTTIETIIQAQNAALIGAMVASSSTAT